MITDQGAVAEVVHRHDRIDFEVGIEVTQANRIQKYLWKKKKKKRQQDFNV
jgi:hypothetical protein